MIKANELRIGNIVDEILKALPEGSVDYGISARRRFFEEVKQEIINLKNN
jgi:hypothetical protein